MTDRERLVERLMSKSCREREYPDVQCDECDGLPIFRDDAERIADHILSDGWMRPPCKVGDVVYVSYYGEIVNAYVTEFELNSKGVVAKVYIDPDTEREYDAEDIHITQEEAEKALRGGEQG